MTDPILAPELRWNLLYGSRSRIERTAAIELQRGVQRYLRYLHRDGRISVPLKGNLWKSCFHHPRMQWLRWRMLDDPDWT